jgi:hypothetical protein
LTLNQYYLKNEQGLWIAARPTIEGRSGAFGNEKYDDIIEKGYRWVAVDGPYASPTKNDLQQITKNRTDETELQMVEQLRAYYLVRGALVR